MAAVLAGQWSLGSDTCAREGAVLEGHFGAASIWRDKSGRTIAWPDDCQQREVTAAGRKAAFYSSKEAKRRVAKKIDSLQSNTWDLLGSFLESRGGDGGQGAQELTLGGGGA